MIDWHAVLFELSPTKITIGIGAYIIVRSTIYVLKFIAKCIKGAALQSEHRAIAYLHYAQDHQLNRNDCQVRDCGRGISNAIR